MINSSEERDDGTYPAIVIDVADPLGLHRIRFTIPGQQSVSDWAVPRTIGGGAGRGGHVMPKINDLVVIEFAYGNKNYPIYSCGWWGKTPTGTDAPADIVAAGQNAHMVQSFEIGNIGGISFRVTLDEREGRRAFRIYAMDTDNNIEIAAIELDLEKRGIFIYGLTGVVLQSDGYIQQTAPIIQMNERTVQTKAGPV